MDTAEKAMFLGHVKIFTEVNAEVLFAISKHLEEINLSAGETLFRKGDPGTSLYIITQGKVRVEDPESGTVYNYLRDFDAFGEMALVDTEPRMASVIAVEDTHLLKLERALFLRIMSVEDRVALGVIKVLNQYLRDRTVDMRASRGDTFPLNELRTLVEQARQVPPNPKQWDPLARRQDALGELARALFYTLRELHERK